jgi:hypothetical protein
VEGRPEEAGVFVFTGGLKDPGEGSVVATDGTIRIIVHSLRMAWVIVAPIISSTRPTAARGTSTAAMPTTAGKMPATARTSNTAPGRIKPRAARTSETLMNVTKAFFFRR